MKIKFALISLMLFSFDALAKSPVVYTAKELEKYDVNINKSYQVVMSLLKEPEKAGLRNAQRKWIKYRDSICEFEKELYVSDKWYADVANGAAKTSCLTRLTKERLSQLDEYLEYFGESERISDFEYNDVLIKSIIKNNTSDNTSEQKRILTRASSLAEKVRVNKGGYYGGLISPHFNRDLYILKDNIVMTVNVGAQVRGAAPFLFNGKYMNLPRSVQQAVSKNEPAIVLNRKSDVVFLKGGALFVDGDITLNHVSDSVIIATGKVTMSHSNNNVVISRQAILKHDGNQGDKSLVITPE